MFEKLAKAIHRREQIERIKSAHPTCISCANYSNVLHGPDKELGQCGRCELSDGIEPYITHHCAIMDNNQDERVALHIQDPKADYCRHWEANEMEGRDGY